LWTITILLAWLNQEPGAEFFQTLGFSIDSPPEQFAGCHIFYHVPTLPQSQSEVPADWGAVAGF
jgi:hypothetical protein